MRGWRGAVVPAVAGLVLLTGCSASGNGSPTPVDTTSASTPIPASSTRPTDAVALSAYAISHGPAVFGLPAGLTVVQKVDQPNVVTLVLTAESSKNLESWLVKNLPTMGYRIDGSGGDSVVFTGVEWSGAYTRTDSVAGLTLRRTGT